MRISTLAKIVATLCGIVVVFGLLWLLNGSLGFIVSALKLYFDFAKEHVVESITFYAIFVIIMFVVDGIVNKLFASKKNNDSKK